MSDSSSKGATKPITAAEFVAELSLQEKASLGSGAEFWTTKAIERVGVPQTQVADGPAGSAQAS